MEKISEMHNIAIKEYNFKILIFIFKSLFISFYLLIIFFQIKYGPTW